MARMSGVSGGVSDEDAEELFEAAAHELQAARDEMPPASSLTDADREKVLQALSELREAAQRVRQEVMNTTS